MQKLLILIVFIVANVSGAEVIQQDSMVILANEFLRIEFNLNDGFWNCYRGGDTVIYNAYGAVKAAPEGGSYTWAETFDAGYERSWDSCGVEDAPGTGTEVIFTHTDNPGHMDLMLKLVLYDNKETLVSQLEVVNSTDTAQKVKEIHPLETSHSWNGAVYFGTVPTGCVVLENAYISWWTCNLREVGNGFSSNSHWNDVIYDPSLGSALVTGFITQKECENLIYLEYSSNNQPIPGKYGFTSFLANSRTGGVLVTSGDTLRSDGVMLDWVDDVFLGLEQYAGYCASFHDVELWSDIPAGWCSWYYYYGGVTENDVIENAEFVAGNLKPYGMEYIQIDDGYQNCDGDWQTNYKFPHGHAWLTSQIHNLGLKAGIWIAPFRIAQNSQVYQNHPDWLVKDPSGNPIHIWNSYYVLDPTHPGAQDWLSFLFSTVVNEWGYDYVKLDFLYFAAGSEQDGASQGEYCYYLDVTPIEAYRMGLEVIKNAIGEDRFILGCGAPIGASFGLVDGMRIGTDIYPSWGQIKACATNTARRYFFHGRIFANDPDCILVRNPLSLGEAQAWASICALSGGMALSSDRLTALPSDRLDVLRKVLPVYYCESRPLDLFEPSNNPPEIWISQVMKDFDNWWVVGLTNWEGASHSISLGFDELGLPRDDYLIYSFWDNQYLGEFARDLTVQIPGNSASVLAIHRKQGVPQVISTDRHISQGAVDLESIGWSEDSLCLSGKSKNLVAGDEYGITVYSPKEMGTGYQFLRAEANVLQYDVEFITPEALRFSVIPEDTTAEWQLFFGHAKIQIIGPENGGIVPGDIHIFGVCAEDIDTVEIEINNEFVGYATIVDTEWFCDWQVDSTGEHRIDVTGVDGEGNRYPTWVNVVVLAMNQGILLVDETRNGTGAPGSPSDEQVDEFYHNILTGYSLTDWDIDSQTSPGVLDLGRHSLVIWHGDDYANHRLRPVLPEMSLYLKAGGKLWLSGWRPITAIMGTGTYPFTFGEGDFPYDYLKLRDADESTSNDFSSAWGGPAISAYPDISVDSTKVPLSWSGRMKYIDVFTPLDSKHPTGYTPLDSTDGVKALAFYRTGVHQLADARTYSGKLERDGNPAFAGPLHSKNTVECPARAGQHEAESIYFFNSASGDTSFQDKPCGIRYLDGPYKFVFLGFPLYFMREDEATLLAHRVLGDLEVGVEEVPPIPEIFALLQNYPNPFREETVISLECIDHVDAVTRSQHSIKIYDLAGRLIRTLPITDYCSPITEVTWDGRDESGRETPSGVYLCRLDSAENTSTKKLVLIR